MSTFFDAFATVIAIASGLSALFCLFAACIEVDKRDKTIPGVVILVLICALSAGLASVL